MRIAASVSRAVAHHVQLGSHRTTRAFNPPRANSGLANVTATEIPSPSRQPASPTPASAVAHGIAAQIDNLAGTQIADRRTAGKPAFSLPSGENFPLRSTTAGGPRATAGHTEANLRLGSPGKPAFSLPSGENFPLRSTAAGGPRATAGHTEANLRLGSPGKPAFSLPSGEDFPLRSTAAGEPRTNPLPAPYAQSAARRPGRLLDLRA